MEQMELMEMSEILAIVNAPIFWVLCGLLVFWVLIQATLFIRLSFKEADLIGYPRQKLKTAIINGAVTAIGPALASVAVMISVIAILGGPISWHRLSVIGAPQTDLAAATVGAQALGFETLGGVGGLFSLEGVAIALLIMTINGCGWLLVTTIFTSKLDTLRVKLSGGDMTWLMLLSAAASIGLFGNFAAIRVVMGTDHMVGVAAAFATQFIIDRFVAPQAPAIRGYAMSIALVVGIFCAAMVGAAS